MTVLLDVKHLQTRFKSRKKYIHAVNDVSFQVHQGEALGVVGESGCGKSVTMLSLLKLLPPAARIEQGQAIFNGNDLLQDERQTNQQSARGANWHDLSGPHEFPQPGHQYRHPVIRAAHALI